MALSQAGAIDPTKPGTYPVILGEDIRNTGDPTKMFTGIRYNFKPKHLAKKSIQHTSTLTAADDADRNSFDVTFRDNSGGRYVYAGTRISKGSKYVLVFDSKRRLFILHRLDSLFVMNMTDTPTNHNAEALKKKHPHITEKTVRRLRQHRVNGFSGAGGAVHPGRRPPIKKSGSGSNALRPLTKPVSRPVPRPPSVLRSSHEISKKSTSGNSNGSSGSSSSSSVSGGGGGGGGGSGSGSISGKSRSSLLEPPDPSRETKAAKDVRQRREDMITKEARDNRDVREKAAREAALRKSKAAALTARPKEGSKLSQETKASPDSKAQLAARAAEVRARIGGKTVPGGSETKKGQTSKAREPAQRKQGGGRKAEGGKSVGGSTTTGKGRSTAAAKSLPLPMPTTTAAAAPTPKKKKRHQWAEQDEEEDDDDGDLGIVIEYPEGPSYRGGGGGGGGHAFTGASGGGGQDRGAPRPQLHMQTFDEFQRDSALGHDGIEEVGPDDDLEGYWDPREDDAAAGGAGLGLGLATAPSPAATPEPALSRPSSSSAQRDRYGGGGGGGNMNNNAATGGRQGKAEEADEMDELEEALMEELKEEEAEEAARRKQREEELEAELMAAFESESEISEEE